MSVDWDKLVVGPTVRIFGDPVRYTRRDRLGVRLLTFDIAGVFDKAYLELTPLGRGGDDVESFSLGSPGAITAQRPVLGVQLSEFTEPPKQSDTLEIMGGDHQGERFEVKEVRPDGHGGAKLLLNAYRGP